MTRLYPASFRDVELIEDDAEPFFNLLLVLQPVTFIWMRMRIFSNLEN